jgi:carboxylesterase
MPGAEPFFARGGSTAVLVTHGFTASPHEVLWLAQHLASEGYTVYAPRLAFHGTNPEDMVRARWQDWLASVLDGIAILRAQSEKVVVSGLSMGATLSLLAATVVPVDGVVAMAAPLEVIGFPPERLRMMKYLRPTTDQTDRGPFAAYIEAEQKIRGEPVYGRVRYGIWKTAAVEQLMRLSLHTRGELGKVRAPVLAMYSQRDETVSLTHLETLKAGLTQAASVEVKILTESSHILTQDMEKETVFRAVSDFVSRV